MEFNVTMAREDFSPQANHIQGVEQLLRSRLFPAVQDIGKNNSENNRFSACFELFSPAEKFLQTNLY
ncbi:MAG: hypothetical protein BGO33_05035 [Bacteroidia bacterium 43-41]|nr:MAG: hypothetical protein BGO33_05035 [Bacteroidia bacterium 43-41]